MCQYQTFPTISFYLSLCTPPSVTVVHKIKSLSKKKLIYTVLIKYIPERKAPNNKNFFFRFYFLQILFCLFALLLYLFFCCCWLCFAIFCSRVFDIITKCIKYFSMNMRHLTTTTTHTLTHPLFLKLGVLSEKAPFYQKKCYFVK